MAALRYEISLLVLKRYFTRSLRSLVKNCSTLEGKFRISARPCNILYLCSSAYSNSSSKLIVFYGSRDRSSSKFNNL